MEEHSIEGATDEDVHEYLTLAAREPTIDGNTHLDRPREDEKCDQRLEDEEEDDWKDTHMESEERERRTHTSRCVALQVETLISMSSKSSTGKKLPLKALFQSFSCSQLPFQLTSKLFFSVATKGSQKVYYPA